MAFEVEGFKGYYHRRMLYRRNTTETATRMAVHSFKHPTYGPMDEIYIMFVGGYVEVYVVLRARADAGLKSTWRIGRLHGLSNNPNWAMMKASEDGERLLLADDDKVTAVPVADCSLAQTCDTCVGMMQHRCGWCASSLTCTRQASCASGGWLQHLYNDTDHAHCPGAIPGPVVISSSTATANSIDVTFTTAASLVNNLTSSDVSYQLVIDDVFVGTPSTVTTPTLTATGLLPYTTYILYISSVTAAGRAASSPITVRTQPSAPTAPLNLTLHAETGPSVRLAWEPPTTANGVLFDYVVMRNGTQISSASLALSYADTGLDAYTVYEYSVHARTVGPGGPSDPLLGPAVVAAVRTVQTAPSQPLNPSISNLDDTSGVLAWTPPTTPNGILIRYSIYLNGQLWWRSTTSPPPTTYYLIGLQPVTEYSATVTASTVGGEGLASTALVFTTSAAPLPQLAPPTLEEDTTGVKVTWRIPASVTGTVSSEVQASLDGGDTWASRGIVPLTTTTDASPPACTSIQYRVRLRRGANLGEWSLPTAILTQPAVPSAPAAPQLMGAVVLGAGSLQLNGSACGLVRYVVMQQVNDGTATEVCCTGLNRLKALHAFRGLAAGSAVRFTLALRVERFDVEINSPPSPALVVTIPGPPEQLPAPVASSIAATSLRLSWTASSAPNVTYDVERNGRRVCCDGDQRVPTKVDDGLLAYTEYTYKVRAVNVEGQGAWSSATTVRTDAVAPSGLVPPALLKATPTSLEFQVTTPSDATGPIVNQTVALLDAASQVVEVQMVPGNRRVTFTELSAGTRYSARYTATTLDALSSSIVSGAFFTEFASSDRPLEQARLRFRIDETFMSSLLDRNSSAWQAMALRVKQAVEAEFSSEIGMQTFEVVEFFQGSVGVIGFVQTIGGPPLQGVVNSLKDAVAAGSLGTVDTMTDSFERLTDTAPGSTLAPVTQTPQVITKIVTRTVLVTQAPSPPSPPSPSPSPSPSPTPSPTPSPSTSTQTSGPVATTTTSVDTTTSTNTPVVVTSATNPTSSTESRDSNVGSSNAANGNESSTSIVALGVVLGLLCGALVGVVLHQRRELQAAREEIRRPVSYVLSDKGRSTTPASFAESGSVRLETARLPDAEQDDPTTPSALSRDYLAISTAEEVDDGMGVVVDDRDRHDSIGVVVERGNSLLEDEEEADRKMREAHKRRSKDSMLNAVNFRPSHYSRK
eukprot:TRINITY_DN11823_c0_g2_i1.p1 TRINITY_DN11823_c0_g2~~TRINITY_DN11823_c0_g2_i1.p1  ORF type:complete len:1359 (+),score=306.53 TRINITY_DN11823_c0_g2_i1:453-4079(+)